MARYIITGSYTAEAIRGLIASPSDRAAAAGALIKAAGGALESFYLTTGDNDFSMTVTTDDVVGMLAALMAAGSTGAVSGMKTVQAFTAAEFLDAQGRAAKLVPGYKAPHKAA